MVCSECYEQMETCSECGARDLRDNLLYRTGNAWCAECWPVVEEEDALYEDLDSDVD